MVFSRGGETKDEEEEDLFTRTSINPPLNILGGFPNLLKTFRIIMSHVCTVSPHTREYSRWPTKWSN